LARAQAKQFVEVFLGKVNPYYYAAIIKGEANVGPALVESIKSFILPLLPDTRYILGEKFGLPEILTAPFVIRLYLCATLGLLGEGIEAKLADLGKWDRWAKAVLANESVRKTFHYEFEARRAIDRVRKIREANKLAAANTTTNGAKV